MPFSKPSNGKIANGATICKTNRNRRVSMGEKQGLTQPSDR